MNGSPRSGRKLAGRDAGNVLTPASGGTGATVARALGNGQKPPSCFGVLAGETVAQMHTPTPAG